jgi:hypothetical protein
VFVLQHVMGFVFPLGEIHRGRHRAPQGPSPRAPRLRENPLPIRRGFPKPAGTDRDLKSRPDNPAVAVIARHAHLPPFTNPPYLGNAIATSVVGTCAPWLIQNAMYCLPSYM